mmetsp:Transcript_39551/g.61696  ORF Transcript_39551/g.61696 Transcript_39551/m.61696 type:complete len:105 (+) Transcript_39551:1030-1344(+)
MQAASIKNYGGGRMLPKRLCCMTGSFPMTSAKYIVAMPLLTFAHVAIPLMSLIIGEFSEMWPDFTCLMNSMQWLPRFWDQDQRHFRAGRSACRGEVDAGETAYK